MIHGEILRKIIRDNDSSKIDTQRHRNETGTLSWSESRIQLRDFISDLDSDCLLDLLAMMDYGRNICAMNQKASYQEFLKWRRNFDNKPFTDQEKKEKAAYLLEKSSLSEYLRAVLPIYKIVEFKF